MGFLSVGSMSFQSTLAVKDVSVNTKQNKIREMSDWSLTCGDCGCFFFPAKSASVRALLFDISFLMLCHVVQTYGSEVRNVTVFFFF